MNNKKIFEKIITEKRSKCSNERPKYGLRKLTVGVVSCLLGYMMFMTPNVVQAEKVDQPQVAAETVQANEAEKVSEESEQPKEEAVEATETEKSVSHVEAYSSNAKETNAQDRTVRTTAEETSETAAEKTTEFKLTDEQKKKLEEAGFDKEQIQKIENDIKLELQKDPNYDVEKHIKDAIEKLNQPELALAPEAPKTGVRDAAPPEDTDTASDAKNAVHGYVGVQVGDDVNKNLAKAGKGQFIPMEGVRVYFQWFEKKGNRVSPVYAATSDAAGQFHMKIKPYIGEDGKLVKFDADTSISAGYESYKFWVDESTIPAGYQLQYSTGESVEFNDTGVAGANNYVIPNKLTDFKVLLMEIPKEDLMHKTDTPTGPQIYPDPVLNVGQGAVRGKVSWDYESAGGIQWGIVATHTSPAPDVKVRASYLSDYALKQIFSAETANILSLSKPSDIRGSGWTFALEKQLQDWIKEQVAKEPDKWIAETVSAVTNAEGEYKIQFNGTWGPERNGINVAKYTAPKRWTQEQKDRLGTVAKNATDGSFLTGALDKNEKHVNSDWLFISTEGTDKLRVMTPWNNNWYTGSNNAWGIHGGWAQAAFGVSTVQAANSTRADFALAPAEIKFNITNYDTGFNTATPGDVAKTETKGLPYSNTSDSFRIVWYDAKGNVVKTENASKPSSIGDFPEATLDTSDVTKTTTYTAKLYRVDAKGNNGQLLAQDSFTVKISKLVVSAHDEVSIENPGANDKSMKGAAYSAEGLPEGLTIDPDNGTISGKATTPGKYTVTVKTSVPDKDSGEDAVGTSQYVALVTDSPLKDGNVNSTYSETVKPSEVEGYVFKNVSAKFIGGKEIAGLTITGDQISGTPTEKVEATQEDPNVEVTYDIYKLNEKGEEVLIKKGHVDRVPLSIKDGEAVKYEPSYTAVEGKVGTEATVKAPTFTDKDGNPATPENVTYELGEGAPTGAKVNADGSVTYTPVDGDAEKAVKIPVVVKYSDGTTDKASAVINVTKNATIADRVRELGGVNPQTIKVWKGDDIDWAKGVVAADDNNSKEVKALLDAATITDKAGRNSNEAGRSEGILKVTFTDGSFIEVPKQMLTVSDHIVTIDPNDPNSPSKDDLPRDSIEVRFVASTGVKKVKTTGTTYVKPGITFKDTDFPQVTFEDGYKAPVTWTPADRIIDINKPGYSKRGYFTFAAKATLEDIIDRTADPTKPTPDGYVRVTFTNGDGVNEIANKKVYDVKEGTALTADKYPTVTAKDGYENPTWSTAPGTAITADNATITATATQKAPAENTADKVQPSYTDADAEVGKQTTITAPNFTDKDGKYTTKPKETKFALGDGAPAGATIDENTGEIKYTPAKDKAGKPVEIPVVVTYKDGSTDEVKATVNVADATTPDTTAPAAPIVTAKDDGSVEVVPPIDEDTKSVDVTYTPEGEDTTPKTVTVTKGEDGKWTTTDKDVTVDPETGKVTIPADKVADNTEVKATAKDEAKNESDPATAIAKPDSCLTKDALQKQFEDVSEKMFGGIGTKDGIYEGEFNKDKKEVTVKIFDKDQDAKQLSGTGLIDGLVKLYRNNHLSQIKIGEKGQVLNLSAIEKATTGITFEQALKQIIGTELLKAVQTPDNQTGHLSDFIDKTVELHLTLHQEGCGEEGDVKLTYTIHGVDGTDTTAPVITAENVTAVEGKEITPVPVTTDDDKATVTVDGLPEGLSYNPETKQIEGTVAKADDWGDEEEKTVTATVKAVDEAGNESTKDITVTIQRDTDGDGTPDVTDTDDDGDGIPDDQDEKPKVADKTTLTVTPETQTKVEGKDGTEIDPIKAESNKPGAKITTDNPNLTVGKDGTITGKLPKIEDWGDDEEERDIEVKVKTEIEGEDPVEKTVTITVQRDTDGDGTPDVTDTDDDGDGIPDDQDKNPKVADKTTLTVTPETQTRVEGKDGTEIDPIKAESNKTGAKITTDNPNLTVAEDGTITGKLPKIEDWGDEEERTIEVKVKTEIEGEDPVEKTVTITVQRDTDGDGTPDVTDTDDDGDGATDEEEKEAGTDPKDPDSKPETPAEKDADKYTPEVAKEEVEKGSTVDLTDNVTNLDKLPKGTTVKDVTPEGTIDTNTPGNYTGKIEVTYPDGSKETVDVEVTVKDTTPAEEYQAIFNGNGGNPTTQKVTVKDGEKVSGVKEPTREGYKFVKWVKLGTDKEFDLSKPFSKDILGGEKSVIFTAVWEKVVSEDTTAPTIEAGNITAVEGQPIPPVMVDVDDVNATVTIEGLPEGLKYNPETKQIEGTVPKAEDWGDKEEKTITATIKAVDETGNESTKEIAVKILRDTDGDGNPDVTDTDDDNDGVDDKTEEEKGTDPKDKDSKPETPEQTDADKYEPEVAKEEVEKGGKVDLTDNVTNLDKLPKGTTVKDVTPEGTIDTNKPGDYTGKVEVTYPDGSKDIVDVPVTIKDTTPAQTDADKYEPEVAKEEVEKGGKVDLTDNVTNLDKLPEGTTVKDVTPEGTIDTNKPGDYTGKVEVTYPDGSKDIVDVPVTVKDTTPAQTDADKYEPEVAKEEVEKGGKVDLTDNVTNLDKLPEGTTVKDVTPEGTIDTNKPGDYTGKVEVTYPDGSKDIIDVPVTIKDTTPAEKTENPTVTVPKAGDTKVTGTATPGSTVTVTLPDGTEIKATADKDGNWTAELPEGKTLAEKDEIKVVAKDGDKEPSEEVKVTVGAKDVTPAEKTDAEKVQPNIPDKTIVNDKNNLTKEEKEKVKEAIEKVNKDKFPEGTKVEIGKDGTATITYPDGSKDTIKGSDLVVGKSNGNTSSIQSGSKKSKNLPKAGIESEAMMMAAAALSTLGGLYVSKKKKENEE